MSEITDEGEVRVSEMRTRLLTALTLWPIQIEGAVDYACGRPREANPYNESGAYGPRAMWFEGWDDAESLFPAERLARERMRWA